MPPSSVGSTCNAAKTQRSTEYLTTSEAAEYLKLSRQFLEAARHRGDGSGPPYIKLRRAVRYRLSGLIIATVSGFYVLREPGAGGRLEAAMLVTAMAERNFSEIFLRL